MLMKIVDSKALVGEFRSKKSNGPCLKLPLQGTGLYQDPPSCIINDELSFPFPIPLV